MKEPIYKNVHFQSIVIAISFTLAMVLLLFWLDSLNIEDPWLFRWALIMVLLVAGVPYYIDRVRNRHLN